MVVKDGYRKTKCRREERGLFENLLRDQVLQSWAWNIKRKCVDAEAEKGAWR